MRGLLRFNSILLLLIAVLALTGAPFFAVHGICLLFALINTIASAAIRLRGVHWLAATGLWLCFGANVVLEHDSRRNAAVAVTATIALLACIAMLVSAAIVKPEYVESEEPAKGDGGNPGVFSRWFGR